MKKNIMFIVIFLSLFNLQGCVKNQNEIEAKDYLRIHIRANSNLEVDQNVKYKIKDKVVTFLANKISECNNKIDVINLININYLNLKQISDNVLEENNFNYKTNIKIKNEYFPTRCYGDYVLKSDFYDALIIELGEAKGDNWWCVVYPPLCFLNASEINNSNIVYKSKIYELIKKFFK